MSSAALIGIDWGTTTVRAYRIAADGSVLDVRCAPRGVQDLGGATFAQVLASLIGDWRDGALACIASGMVGSRNGWLEVPYVEAPATLDALARGIRRTPGGELAIVPGVLVRDAQRTPDVMRGEETQVYGALAEGARNALLVLPGTHSKWVQVRDGALAGFATWMTGDIDAVMLRHSILGRLAEGAAPVTTLTGAVLRVDWVDGAIAHDLFGARSLVLTGELAAADVADFLSGLLIGREVRDGRSWASAQGALPDEVLVVGADALCARYVLALCCAGIAAREVPAAAPRGLRRIAQAASRLTHASPR